MGLLGAIEAGGTKFVVAVADENFNIIDRTAFPTLDGEKTLDQVIAFFDQYDNIDAIGIAAFGPIDIVPESKTYGYVLDTPKHGWSGYNFLGRMKAWRDIPYYWTTDVNGAGWAEFTTGAAKDVDNMVYLTVGTGVGAGIVSGGQLVSGYVTQKPVTFSCKSIQKTRMLGTAHSTVRTVWKVWQLDQPSKNAGA